MRNLRIIMILLIAGLFFEIIPRQNPFLELPPSEQEKVSQGEIVFHEIDEGDAVGIEAWFLLRAPRSSMWGAIMDYPNYPIYFDNVQKIKILQEDKNGATVELWINALVKKFHYVAERKYVLPGRKVEWNRVSGDFKTNKGSWEIFDIQDKNHCLVRYRTIVELGGISGKTFRSLARSENRRRIIKTVDTFRSRLESGLK